jgi:CDP-glucose 4,6-dehydratase
MLQSLELNRRLKLLLSASRIAEPGNMLKNNDFRGYDPAFWLNRRVMVTGHTGFLGSWIACWLSDLGADVTGFARRPASPASLFGLAGLDQRVTSLTGDMRDRARVEQTVTTMAPEIVFHLAGKRSASGALKRPLDSFDTNATGTLNLLHAARCNPELRAVVIVTTDQPDSPTNADSRADLEPIAASLACAEIIAETFRQCYLQPADGIGLATLRLPEIVGGGDFGPDRLVPDVMRAIAAGRAPAIDAPSRAHPLLHVLDALACCLSLASALLQRPRTFARSWSLAPATPAPWTSAAIAHHVAARLGAQRQPSLAPSAPLQHRCAPALRLDPLGLRSGPDMLPHEPDATPLLQRGPSIAAALGWRPRLDVETALDWALDGYRRLEAAADGSFIADQRQRFEALAPPTGHPALSIPHPATPATKASHVALPA